MLKGPTSTLSCSTASFSSALIYAYEILKNNKADSIIVVSSDECTKELLEGNNKLGILKINSSKKFSRNNDGMFLTPGSVALVLEKESTALKRNTKIYCSFRDYYFSSDNYALNSFNPDGTDLYYSIKKLLENNSVDLIINSALGMKNSDLAELNCVKRLEKNNILKKAVKITNISDYIGIASGSHSGFMMLNAIFNFEKNHNIRKILTNSIGLGGSYFPIIIERYK